MASAPSDPRPIFGRVDRDGRLIAADPELERLQVQAGSAIGRSLALPQLAAVVRIAQRLRIPVSRRVLAAGRDQDVDMWVRAVPEDGEVAISIEQWTARPASPPRLSAMAAVEHEQLSAAPLGWSVDQQLRIVALAPALAERLSTEPSAAAGQPLTRFFKLEENEDGEMPLLAALASRSGFSGQRAVVRNDGQQLVLGGEVTVGQDGAFAGFEGSAVAPAAAEEQALQPVDPALHTALRAPLSNIVQTAEEMAADRGGEGPDEYAAYAADIATAARHLLSVIRSLGDQSQARGEQSVDLVDLTREAVALVEPAASERGIAIAVQPAQALLARADARGVIQILVNLLGNAVRYTRENTAVTVSFEKAAQSVQVHVADEGPGIDPADQQRIFEPFEQANSANGGSGLGLAISRRLARGMSGDIRLDSRPGEGARFTLALPAA